MSNKNKINFKKLNTLLDETTIINFQFFFVLFNRYLKSSLTLLAFVFLTFVGFYLLQKDVFWSSVRFSDTANNLAKISKVMDEKNEKDGDILSLKVSLSFADSIAENLISNPEFKHLRFDLNFFGNQGLSVEEMIKVCGENKQCLKKKLIKVLPNFFTLNNTDRVNINYVLEVKALNELTSHTLVRVIAKTIQEFRTEALRRKLSEEEKTSLALLEQANKEILDLGYQEQIQQLNVLDEELKDLDNQITLLGKTLVEQQSRVSQIESRVIKTNKMLDSAVDFNEAEKEKKLKDYRARIENLANDINALEVYSTSLSGQDHSVLMKLKTELKRNQDEMMQLGPSKGITNVDELVKDNEMKRGANELNFKVFTDQFKKTQAIHREKLSRKQIVLEKKAKLEESLEFLKPKIDFIKTLRTNVSDLSYLKSTTSSELIFDQISNTVPAKKLGKVIMLAYLIISSSVFLLLYLALRFVWDDKIYDSHDLVRICNAHVIEIT